MATGNKSDPELLQSRISVSCPPGRTVGEANIPITPFSGVVRGAAVAENEPASGWDPLQPDPNEFEEVSCRGTHQRAHEDS